MQDQIGIHCFKHFPCSEETSIGSKAYLIWNFTLRYLMQVLQMRMEEGASDKLDPKNRLYDVTDGAVIGKSNLLGCVYKVATTAEDKTNLVTDVLID